jgi:uncharacterized protein (DUF1800 family)
MPEDSLRPLYFFARFALLAGLGGILSTAQAANPGKSPVLLSEAASTRAIAFESATMKPEPFPLTASVPFGSDTRTRIAIFAINLELFAGEELSAFTADAEDATGKRYALRVEYMGQVPGFEGITMFVVRLADDLGDAGDVLLRLNLHGMSSNRVRVAIGHMGGGPAVDPTTEYVSSAPASPPPPDPAATPNAYTDPAFAAGGDGVRFLEQATWGPTDAELTRVRSMGYRAWIDDQFNQPVSSYPTLPLYPTSISPCDAICARDNYSMYPLRQRFFQNALTKPDQLRQRVAFALHKLIPVSGRDLNNEPSWVAPYLQIMDQQAFGNFRNILFQVTLNPAMGNYLDMSGNSKASPNENYAREIMQLFSIGVDTLNQDGTPVLDVQGNRVPSYDNATITNLARVFTGWQIIGSTPVTINGTVFNVPDYITPMPLRGNTNTYDIGQKTLLNGLVLPACTNCTSTANFQAYKTNELNAAIDNLFNHPNTGSYVCRELIHQLVTSNPSPPYVGRCAAAFANNGSGVRGDMKAVISAILLDIEARGDVKTDPDYGHLREPLLLITNVLRVFNATSDFNLAGSSFTFNYPGDLGQDPFNPTTVFSYFPADYAVPGTTLFGPEFGIMSSSTALKRANFFNTLLFANGGNGIPPGTGPAAADRPTGTQLNFSAYQPLAANPQQLVNALDAVLMHDTMSAPMKASIVQNVTNLSNSDGGKLRTQNAIYLIMTSSQYQVER